MKVNEKSGLQRWILRYYSKCTNFIRYHMKMEFIKFYRITYDNLFTQWILIKHGQDEAYYVFAEWLCASSPKTSASKNCQERIRYVWTILLKSIHLLIYYSLTALFLNSHYLSHTMHPRCWGDRDEWAHVSATEKLTDVKLGWKNRGWCFKELYLPW